MKTRLTKLLLICFALFLLSGCASSNPFGGRINDLRIKGYRSLEKWYHLVRSDSVESFHEVVKIEIEVHIVGGINFFKWPKGATYSFPVAGYATEKDNEIFVLGKKVGDKIIVNEVVLGHELNHILNFKNSKIVNPDKLGKMGL